MKKILFFLYVILSTVCIMLFAEKCQAQVFKVEISESPNYGNVMGFITDSGISGYEELTQFTSIDEVKAEGSLVTRLTDLVVVHHKSNSKSEQSYVSIYHFKTKSDKIYQTTFYVSKGSVAWVVGNYLLTIDDFKLNIKETMWFRVKNYQL